jgi:ectoine hydroxylase-related dioxygenase (phytanoyl-CoA dioxygenase family)
VTAADVVCRSALDRTEVTALQDWAVEIQSWPAGSHVWGHYAEQTLGGKAICRTENVSACHKGVRSLVDGRLGALATERLGEPATAFKDKINYKQPGGAGFSPHQDAVAYPGVGRVLSLLVALDECTTESGCLWMAPGVDRLLAADDRGVVMSEAVDRLSWLPVTLAPGDAVCLTGFAPHYSEANRTDRPRRVLVASYSPSSEQYGRADYYAARRVAMEQAPASDGRFRISTLADFEGREVTLTAAARDSCTHSFALAE